MIFKIRRSIFILFVIIFISGNLYVIYNISQKNRVISSYQKIRVDSESLFNFFVDREVKGFESENWMLNPQTMIFNINGDSCTLGDKSSFCPLLVFRFSAQNCRSCIDTELERIKKNLMVDNQNVMIVASGKTERELSLLKAYNSLDYDFYYFKEDTLDIPIDKYNIPYLFLLNCDGRVSSVFLPVLDNDYLSEQFYNSYNAFFNSGK
ncbi:hypothetical protein GM418_30960 [Maribellus comscasis]|uniref:Thioredoxin domain-containing protein n=1 Tax=Maribellus comscasis TaxID=2681766 RepID=A0A6I6K380_9BACT|nr:hypothetical protein [Maribellus comscasis]QGY47918.1 hypothetical protein GM418_30960 [Maribellus comscasis]